MSHLDTLAVSREVVLAVFSIAAIAGCLLVVLSAATWFAPRLAFWPPPQVDSWQYRTFWWLFRVLVLGVVMSSFLDFGGLGRPLPLQRVVGTALAAMGFGLAFWATHELGWRDAHGEANALKTTGWFGWSRNPIYVVSIVGMAGLGLLAHSAYVYTLLALWATMYLVAPFLEEPWLELRYGDHSGCTRLK